MKKYILSLLVVVGLIVSASAGSPTPQEIISSLIGTWEGSETLYYNGQQVDATFRETIEPLGDKGLGYLSKATVYIPYQQPSTAISYQYDTGQLEGVIMTGGLTTGTISGTWSINNRTITGSATVSSQSPAFTMNTQTMVLSSQMFNSTANASYGAQILVTAKKISDDPYYTPPPPTPTPNPPSAPVPAVDSGGGGSVSKKKSAKKSSVKKATKKKSSTKRK